MRSADQEKFLRSFRFRSLVLLMSSALCMTVAPLADAQGAVPRAVHAVDTLASAISGARSPVALKAATEPLDIDANLTTDALTDGLLVLRYLFGLRGSALVQGAVGAGATRNTSDIESYLAGMTTGAPATLDIDSNGAADALTDGLLVIRYLFGLRGSGLINGAIGGGASRTTSSSIESYMATLTSSTPQPPGGCSVVAAPTSSMGSPLPQGTSVQLTVNCTSGQQPITYNWNNGAFVGSVRTVAPNATTTYSVVASNGAGPAPAVTSTVYVAAITNYCLPGDQTVDVPWPNGQTKPSTNGFANQIYSFRLTIPYTFNPPLNNTHLGFVKISEVPGQNVTAHEYTVSASPCDFHAPKGGYLLDNFGDGDTAPQFNFTVNNPGGVPGSSINFQSGDVVYVNVRNYNYNNGSPVPTCPNGTTCDIYFDYATPNRY
jgi:hypothetical protein